MKNIWHHHPFIRIAAAFVAGIIMAYYFKLSPLQEVWLIAMFTLVFVGVWAAKKVWRRYQLRRGFGVLITLVIVLAGMVRYSQDSRQNYPVEIPSQNQTWHATVSEYPVLTERSIKIEVNLQGYKSDSRVETLPGGVLIFAKQTSGLDTLIPGDQLVFHSAIFPFEKPINPGQFDYGAYLKKHGIGGMTFLNDEVSVSRSIDQPFQFFQSLKIAQHHLVEIFNKYDMHPRELGVASALVLGYRAGVDPSIKKDYADAGVVHILAVSGLHVGIIYLVFQWILTLIFRKSKFKWMNLVLLLILLWIYAGITGFSPSVLRATTMFSFIAIGKQVQRNGSIYNMLAVSATVLLMFNPMLLFEVGFQLSYLAVLGIALFFKPIHDLWIIKNRVLDKVWSLMVVSFTAQLATFPLAIFYFHQFPNYFLLTNLLIIPMATLGLYLGLASLVFSWVPGLDWVLLKALEIKFYMLNSTVEWFALLPYAKTEFLYLKPISVIFFYLLIFSLYKFFQSPLKWKIWWPISFVFILIVMYSVRKIAIYTTNEIVILEGSKEPILMIQSGTNAWVKSIYSREEFEAKEAFYLSGYRNEKGITHLTVLPKDSMFDQGFVRWSNDTLQANISIARSESNAKNDLVIVNSIPINHKDSNAVYLINSKLAVYKKSAVLTALNNSGQTTWDMKTQGYWSRQID